MKVTFILPAIGKKKGKKFIGTWKMEPLTIAVLNALTPDEIETTFFDDRIESINYDEDTDVVAISVETYSAKRAYEISKEYKKRGKTIILGGYHPTLVPDEAEQHADSILIGNADGIWATMLRDFLNGKLKKRYIGTTEFADIIPDRSIFSDKKYLKMNLVETGRGCKFNCSFCAIAAYYDSKYVSRKIETIVSEIKQLKQRAVFFVDDNIVADQEFAIELFKAITPLKIRWFGQATLTMAKNQELLYWMKKSGGEIILIGFESLEEKNLEQMSKEWRMKIGEQNQLIKNIHKAGLGIYGTFVFGFHQDSTECIDNALNFAKKHNFYIAAFNHLLPLPGTPLYNELVDSRKLKKKNWWMMENSYYGEVVFDPKQMSSEQLSYYCFKARQRYFSLLQIIKRGIVLLKRKPSMFIYLYHWIISFQMKLEVKQKYGLPIGKGLNEDVR
jgi:radical SAM superfamily enzyme YgiQ (UPF0313 family)